MNRTATLAVIALLSAVATPVVVNATTSRPSPVVAPIMMAVPKVEEPTCMRRIKVVYAGYGAAQATPCTVSIAKLPPSN